MLGTVHGIASRLEKISDNQKFDEYIMSDFPLGSAGKFDEYIVSVVSDFRLIAQASLMSTSCQISS